MIRKMKPTTSGLRQVSYADFSAISKKRPEKSLVSRIKKHSGRDWLGHVSVRHQGGGAKKLYRLVDFKSAKPGLAEVLAIEYDPNRTCFIALVRVASGEKRYILAPKGLKPDDKISFGEKSEINPGNRMKLLNIPLGTQIHNVELYPGRGGQIARSAGQFASLVAKDPPYAHIKMPSGEIRKILLSCYASIGSLSNWEHNLTTIGKAGRMRHMGIRPTVRGKAMHPAAHPHGGGEGVNPIGLKYPKTKWGKHALGVKTRRNKKTNQFIVKHRK